MQAGLFHDPLATPFVFSCGSFAMKKPSSAIIFVILASVLANNHVRSAPTVAIPIEASEAWQGIGKRVPSLSGTLTIVDRRKVGEDPETVRTTERRIKISKAGAIMELPHSDSQTRIFGSNSRYSFVLTRKPGNPDCLLDEFSEEPGKVFPRLLPGSVRDEVAKLVSVPYMAGNIRPMDLLDPKQFQINEITASVDRTSFKRIHFSKVTAAKGATLADSGWIDCNPAQAWIIAGGQFTRVDNGVPVSFSFTTLTKMSSEGLPIPQERRTTLSATRKDGRHSVGDIVVKYDLIESEDFSDKDFSLSASGLPEPGSNQVQATSSRHLWLGGSALVCATVAIALWYCARRRQSSAR